jgi:class 3 adenylate cyclase/predicted ATPase
MYRQLLRDQRSSLTEYRMDIAAWLQKLGLERFEPAFRENRIDSEILPRLTAEDLKDLGVTLVGDRRRLLDAVAALRAGTSKISERSAEPIAGPPAASDPIAAAKTAAMAEHPSRSERSLATGERRHLTVIFCDLVGSTEIAARLDAEEWRDILADYHRAVAEVVTRFGGHVAKNLGDGALVYFGYPHAQENDAERALRAGLALVDAVAAQSRSVTTPNAPKLAVRVGIHAGPIVLSPDGELYGEVPNVAARVQALTEPGTVLITGDVHRLVSGLFVVSDRGPQMLKGVRASVTLFQVMRASGVGNRRVTARVMTPLVGRQGELRTIEDRWERARAGQGQFVVLVGEAGLGKSRLTDEFRSRIADAPHTWIEFACSQLLQNTPFHPVVEFIQRRLEEQATTPEARLDFLAAWHRAVGLDPAQSVPLVAPLLELPVPADYPPPPAAPEKRRRKLISTLVAWITGGARTQPILLHVDDIHWGDPSTLDLLRVLAEQGAAVPLMVLTTSRPEFRISWPPSSHHTVVSLTPLDRGEVQQMVSEVAARHVLNRQTMEALITRTGGVPLFVEEVTRLLLEGGGQSAMQAIPATLQALLAARLDRLQSAKEVAQIAAVIGREFSYPLIRAIAGESDAALAATLERLAEADLIHVQGIPPDSSYRFKHALMQDAAYETMLKSRRRELHRAVAQILQNDFHEIADAQPELLAYHLTQAGVAEEAIGYWQRAGQQAIERSANVEAIAHLSHGLELVQVLPEGAARDQLELDLRVALGVPLIASRGYAAPEIEATYARARELSEKIGGSPQFANALWGLWVRYLTGGPIGAALEMAERYRAVAERTQDSGHLLETCQVMGIALFYLGRFRDGVSYLARGSLMYDPERHHALIYEHGGADTGVAIRTHEALALWTLGYPDQARRRMQHALETAAALASHPFTVAFGHYFNAWLHKLCREDERVEQATGLAIQICEEQSFPFWQLASTALRGSALAERGPASEGVGAMRESLAAYEAIGGALYGPELHGLLGIGMDRSGQAAEALQAVTDALRKAEQSQDRWWEAELHRLKGELTLALAGDHAAEAEAAFEQAVALARAQQAKSWELRAATSLARLWRHQGRVAQARQLLGEVHGWFTEGFDTADLREAATLIADLDACVAEPLMSA